MGQCSQKPCQFEKWGLTYKEPQRPCLLFNKADTHEDPDWSGSEGQLKKTFEGLTQKDLYEEKESLFLVDNQDYI